MKHREYPYNPFDLSNEATIVWLEDIEKFDYVRVTWSYCARRNLKPHFKALTTRLVGYAVPKKGNCMRRIFLISDWDRGGRGPKIVYTPGSPPPSGAVDPRTVAAGVARERNARTYGSEEAYMRLAKSWHSRPDKTTESA